MCCIVVYEDRVTVHADNVYRKFRELTRVIFEICEGTDRHSDIQTDMQKRPSQYYFTSLPGLK